MKLLNFCRESYPVISLAHITMKKLLWFILVLEISNMTRMNSIIDISTI